jgi:hypothetical protein
MVLSRTTFQVSFFFCSVYGGLLEMNILSVMKIVNPQWMTYGNKSCWLSISPTMVTRNVFTILFWLWNTKVESNSNSTAKETAMFCRCLCLSSSVSRICRPYLGLDIEAWIPYPVYLITWPGKLLHKDLERSTMRKKLGKVTIFRLGHVQVRKL